MFTLMNLSFPINFQIVLMDFIKGLLIQMLFSFTQLAHPQDDLFLVNQIEPAFNETFVLFCQSNEMRSFFPNSGSVLLHVDKNNNPIKRYDLKVIINKVMIISPQQVIASQFQSKSKYFIINLIEKTIKVVPIKAGFNQIGIFSFPETGFIGISLESQEQKEQNQRKGLISYFHLNKAVLEYELSHQILNNKEYADFYPEQPGNRHSLLYFYKKVAIGNKSLDFLLHDIVIDKGKLSSRVREIAIPTPAVPLQNLCKLWEVRKDKLAVVYMSNIFIYDLNNSTSRMLELNLTQSFNFLHLHTDFIFLKNFILQKDYSENSKNLRFIGIESEQLEFSHQDKEMGKNLINIKADPFDPEFFLETQLQLGSKMLHIKRTSPFLLRQRYMMFLLHLNEDFDDDLLFDALDALDVLDCIVS